jgi:hypothetical protein
MKDSFNNQFATQKLREAIDETSTTSGAGSYLTKPGAKRSEPKPTSGYKDVKGFRAGHSKLKVVEPKDLWDLNEVGVKEKPEKAINYSDGEKIELGDRVKTDNDLEGVINGFSFNDEEQKETIFLNVDKGGGSSVIRPNIPFFQNQLELIKKAPVKQVNPSDSAPEEPIDENVTTNSDELKRIESLISKARDTKNYSVISAYENRVKELKLIKHLEKKLGKELPVLTYGENFSEYINSNLNKTGKAMKAKDVIDSILNQKDSLQEGIKQNIKNRSRSEQFYEAAKQANKKLQEVNKILEYAAELKSQLKEDEGIVESTNSIMMMEKAKKRMVSAYAKMKSLEEESKGLWANIRAKRERGEAPAKKGSKAYKSAVKAAKEINKNS